MSLRLPALPAGDAELLAAVDAACGARGRLDCHAMEDLLERELEEAGAGGETLIAFALSRQASPPHGLPGPRGDLSPSLETAPPSASRRDRSRSR